MEGRIGPYAILSPLGAGGMGEVYRAHDAKLGRDVALKLLPRDLADDPDRRARMVREARAAASLNHPNICTIYEVGEADGQHFIAMEVIDGQRLSHRLAERLLSLDEVLPIAVQLADAVAHAHDRGIVHRDLKSANVMVTPEGRVKVLDFGLAKRLSGDEVTEVTTHADGPLTAPHTILGTLAYMSPEQLRGQPADARSDVWALGIILYEMASGVRPFDGRTGFEIGSAIMHDAPPPLLPRVAVPLKNVIGRCLEKEPGRRYQRASELRVALETMRANGVVQAGRSPVERRRLLLIIAVASLVTGLTLTAMLIWRGISLRSSARRVESIAVLPLENRSGNPAEEYFVAGIHEGLITDLARIGLAKVIAKSSADAFKGTKKPLRDIARELDVERLVTGSVARVGSQIQVSVQLVDPDTGAVVWANRYERNAGDILSLQNEVVGAIAQEVQARLTPAQAARLATARPVDAAAHDAHLKGKSLLAAFMNSAYDSKRFDAAVAQFEQAIRIDPTYAPPHAGLSLTFLTASQTSILPPRSAFPNARAAALKAVALDDLLPEGHALLGEVNLWYDWNWAVADREIQRALQLNPDSTDALRASQTFLTLVASRFDDAARTSQRILTLDPLNPFSRVQPAWVAFYSRRHDDSIRFARDLREVWPTHLMAPIFLASNYAVRRMPAQTRAECGKLMQLLAGAYVMRPIAQCAWAYAAVGDGREARRLLQIVEHPPAGRWLDPAMMGQVYGELGEVDRAIEWYKQGLEERSPSMIYMKAGVPWDAARGDPRFQAMLRQMNFPR